MKLVFLESKLNFSSKVTIFSGLLLLNLSQSLRYFIFLRISRVIFFADPALFVLNFFAGQIFVKSNTTTKSSDFSASVDVL